MYDPDLRPLCGKHVDTIPALMKYEELLAVPRTGAQHSDIFSPSVDIQRETVYQFWPLLQARERSLDWEEQELELIYAGDITVMYLQYIRDIN